MRQSLTVALLCMTMQSAHSSAPKVDYTPRCIDVTGVERTDSCTRISIEFNHFPGNWVMIPSTTFLTTENDTVTHYKIIGEVNIPLDKKIRMPKSGYQSGELLFERVPDDINIVDMVIETIDKPTENILGIHLDEIVEKVVPKFTTPTDIVDSKERSQEVWNGLDPTLYRKMPFYKKDGIAHIRGRIDGYTPRIGLNKFTIRTQNDLTGEQKIQMGTVNPDGTFSLDFPLAYPQYDYFSFGNLSKNIFFAPGDTIDIVASMKVKFNPDRTANQEYFGYVGNLGYASLVNILTDSIYKKYNLKSLHGRFTVADTDSMKEMTMKSSMQLASLLDSTIIDMKHFLSDIPVSREVKDMAAAYTIGKIWEKVEDLGMRFSYAKGVRVERDEAGNPVFDSNGMPKMLPAVDSLDYTKLLAPYRDKFALIYDNPLMICTGFILPNRWKYNEIFHPSLMIACGYVNNGRSMKENPDTYELLLDIDKDHKDKYGFGNCFVPQLARTAYLIEDMDRKTNPDEKYLPVAAKRISNLIRLNEYQPLNEVLMEKYAELVKEVTLSNIDVNNKSNANSIIIDTTDSTDPLGVIIAPYLGNVLFVDFWGIGCGPCRASMMTQKPVLEHYSDKPFKALYIAKSTQRTACEKWLDKEEIKGEHIYVSEDTWNALSYKLNFSGIPFSILIGKDGKEIIATNIHLTVNDPTVEKALKE